MLQFYSPLGPDKLLLESFGGGEEISRLFHFYLELCSEETGLAATQLVGQPACVEIDVKESAPRYFHGRIARFAASGIDQRGLRSYRAELVPWTWLMTHRHGCRIFQNMSVLDIAKKLFGELGFADYEVKADGKYAPLEYCVQYRESDWDFLSRLFEEFGLFYFFRHEKARHVLVLGDSKTAWQDCVESEPRFVAGSLQHSHIGRWEHGWEFISGGAAHADYNYLTATKKLYKETKTVVPLGETKKFETYDYPGRFPDDGQGDARVHVRMEEQEVSWDVAEGDSTCKSFTIGGKFKLADHDVPSEKGKAYVLLMVAHSATDRTHRNTSDETQIYTNTFKCVPATTPFRPARRTPKPHVYGPQTAVVVGPGGEEIFTDEHGRIKVQFHWDREGKKDQNSSCWIRVAQSWAGKNWGAQFLPRIGQEVVVEFLEGDPDRPLVTGSVYNSFQTPTFTVPANKTQSGLRTRSTLGGGAANCNELRFEDKKGSEEVYLHAEKDQLIEVENDEVVTVGHDQSISVGHDQSVSVKNDQTITVEGNRTESITKDRSLTVTGNKSESVEKNKTVSITGSHSESISGDMSLSVDKSRTMSVTKDLTESVDGKMSVTVAKDSSTTISGAMTLQVSKDSTTSVTKKYALKAKSITIEADDEITIKTGSAKISMKKSGDISIEGGKINIKGSGDVVIKGSKVTAN
jgi:type VI secretion system secreted protein VgrG